MRKPSYLDFSMKLNNTKIFLASLNNKAKLYKNNRNQAMAKFRSPKMFKKPIPLLKKKRIKKERMSTKKASKRKSVSKIY